MQMSHANVIYSCECTLVGMQWCICPLVGMPWCECLLIGMQWMRIPVWVCNECKCLLESMPWHECPLVGIQWMQMPPYGYIVTQMLWCKHNLFKDSLYFQNKASSAPETKIFSKLDLLFMKKSSSFWLRAPTKWWSLLEISEWALTWNLMIWLKIFIFTIWLSKRGGTFPRHFSEKMNSLKIKHLEKIHFFSSWIWQFDKRQDPSW